MMDNDVISVAVLLVSQGPHEMAAQVDPYWDAADWHAAARGDGRSYAGVIARITPEHGESQRSVLARAKAAARAYNTGR